MAERRRINGYLREVSTIQAEERTILQDRIFYRLHVSYDGKVMLSVMSVNLSMGRFSLSHDTLGQNPTPTLHGKDQSGGTVSCTMLI